MTKKWSTYDEHEHLLNHHLRKNLSVSLDHCNEVHHAEQFPKYNKLYICYM